MTVDLALAKRENWTKNSKYKTMPEQMLKHRANKWLISMYAPEVLLGLDFEHFEESGGKNAQRIESADKNTNVQDSKSGLGGIFDEPARQLAKEEREPAQVTGVTITEESGFQPEEVGS